MTPAAKSSLKKTDFVTKVQKRDGSIVPFDLGRITNAVRKAMLDTGEGSLSEAELIANKVLAELVRTAKKHKTFVPTVEGIQNEVETQLILSDYVKTAKAYILFREKRAKIRAEKGQVPPNIRKLVSDSRKYLKNPLSEFVYYRTYARWLESEGRRETWIESVNRFMDFMREKLGTKLSEKEYKEIHQAILNQDVCPSMRLLWSAGKAARESNVCAYNCSYIAPTKLRDFGEIMYILMCGAGIGYSVEFENVEKLPQIKKQTGKKLKTHVVEDSKEGWANAFVLGLEVWFSGKDIDFDYSKLRPAGARLKTMGGRSSGPQPLVNLMNFARDKILARQGRRLRTIDVHDIICKTGEIVVAGGVRRSALISLSNLDDPHLRDAKKGQFYVTEPQRSMANNSAVYEKKPSAEELLDEWTALVKSRSGERGIFNRGGLERQVPKRRWQKIKKKRQVGTNPCGEINLQSKQFCNLSSIVIRPDDTKKSLKEKMRVATILGTYQATLTDFAYLSKEWKKNCDEEALLGVSLTGYYDNSVVRSAPVLKDLREEAVRVNKIYAKRFDINPSTSITTVKPHGNSSSLLDTGSGMHPRFARYYIRRVRISRTDPLHAMLKDQGVPCHPEVGQSEESAFTYVFDFPVKSPRGAILKNDVSALELLEQWKLLKESFTEHNPSVTISVGEDEWIGVANFLYENWDIVGGLSFLPRDDHVYQLAPYEEISREKYDEIVSRIGKLDFSKLVTYEKEDHTEGAKEMACASGVCEIDDVLAKEARKGSAASK